MSDNYTVVTDTYCSFDQLLVHKTLLLFYVSSLHLMWLQPLHQLWTGMERRDDGSFCPLEEDVFIMAMIVFSIVTHSRMTDVSAVMSNDTIMWKRSISSKSIHLFCTLKWFIFFKAVHGVTSWDGSLQRTYWRSSLKHENSGIIY